MDDALLAGLAQLLHASGVPCLGPLAGTELLRIASAIPADAVGPFRTYRQAILLVAGVAAFQQRLAIDQFEALIHSMREDGE